MGDRNEHALPAALGAWEIVTPACSLVAWCGLPGGRRMEIARIDDAGGSLA